MSIAVVFCVVGECWGRFLLFGEDVLGCFLVLRLGSCLVHDCVQPD